MVVKRPEGVVRGPIRIMNAIRMAFYGIGKSRRWRDGEAAVLWLILSI
jgi:hypothetical protein